MPAEPPLPLSLIHISVVISTFAALTITPMLATKLLVRQEKKSWFYSKTEPFFVWLNDFYSRTLASFLRRRWLALPLVLLTMGLIGWLWSAIPAEMAPLEDRSDVYKRQGLLLILSQGLPEPNIINKRTTLRFLFTTNCCLWVGSG